MEKTLLDEFAMAALEGMLSGEYIPSYYKNYSEEAYKQALAMMEERKKHIKETEDGGWIDWNNGANGEKHPNDDVEVEIEIRAGYRVRENALNLRWSHNGSPSDIIKYRVLK